MTDRLTDERLAELAQRPQRTFLTEVPLLVALVTKRVTSGAVKGMLLTSFSVAAGLLSEIGDALTTGESFDPLAWLIVTLTALIAGQTTYSAIWKPVGTAEALQRVGTEKEEQS